jgi:hypothetical protein
VAQPDSSLSDRYERSALQVIPTLFGNSDDQAGKRLGLQSFDADANDGWALGSTQRQLRVEVRIQRDNRSPLSAGEFKDCRIIGGRQTDVADVQRVES